MIACPGRWMGGGQSGLVVFGHGGRGIRGGGDCCGYGRVETAVRAHIPRGAESSVSPNLVLTVTRKGLRREEGGEGE
jgi:hypothetical protein